jgi:predicted ABC-type ATPase
MPQVIVIAGPNGAGKSTSAPALVAGIPFVNADEIAKGLSPQPGQNVNLQAGRLMLEQLDDLERQRANFALETTLASRALAPRLERLRSDGYQVRLVFFWLPSVELAIQRVSDRVRRGGHDIPEDTIRRRYRAGLANFFDIYQELAETWQLMENGADTPLRLVAGKTQDQVQIHDEPLWQTMQQAVTP